jgi:hypothetical protein
VHTSEISFVILHDCSFFLNMCSWWLEEVYLRYSFRFFVLIPFFISVRSYWLEKWFLYPSALWELALICFSKKFTKRGDCWVFVLTALLLKQISIKCVVRYYVPTWFRHPYEMLDRMFQHPGTVQCAWVHAYLYARLIFKREQLFLNLMTKQRTYLYIISWAFIPKRATIF